MRRDLYRGLPGGAESALAWGVAEMTARGAKRQRRMLQLTRAIETWEDEGGATADRMQSSGARRAAWV